MGTNERTGPENPPSAPDGQKAFVETNTNSHGSKKANLSSTEPDIHGQRQPNSKQSELSSPNTSLPDTTGTAFTEQQVRVYLPDKQRIETVALEQYVRGVVAAEMPASFELEALKAQAIATRTYIVRRLVKQDRSGLPQAAGANADVTGTTTHQAYLPLAKLNQLPDSTTTKLNRAIDETRDLVLTYKGEPIIASFFSTSNGFTENAEDYWRNPIPYLRSVPSPWDKHISPRYKETVRLNVGTFLAKLGIDIQSVPAFKQASKSKATVDSAAILSSASTDHLRILAYTEGKRVAKARVGTYTFTGRELREKLALRSSAIEWKLDGNELLIMTYGYGHGVGMSQYGAQGLAKKGLNAAHILTYYYKEVEFAKASKILNDIN
ncbi:stage II sporulation protein D [Paenibacillus sp. 481]|nr:stage II sporulation protein D [Paenibacillus sp. 481]